MISWIILVIILVISLLIVIKAADLFVDNLVEIGTAFGISEIILGVTAAAVGTSLPNARRIPASISGILAISANETVENTITLHPTARPIRPTITHNTFFLFNFFFPFFFSVCDVLLFILTLFCW